MGLIVVQNFDRKLRMFFKFLNYAFKGRSASIHARIEFFRLLNQDPYVKYAKLLYMTS